MTITPLVNLNGTSPEQLIEQQRAVLDAADQLIKALHEASPNGRDYYPKPGPENWTELARREHQERIRAVQRIMQEAMDVALSVQEQANL